MQGEDGLQRAREGRMESPREPDGGLGQGGGPRAGKEGRETEAPPFFWSQSEGRGAVF